MKWLDEAQEFVWMDARKIGDRIYHASCYAEATKDVNTQTRKLTPEIAPVLGKRKHEVGLTNFEFDNPVTNLLCRKTT